MTDRILTVTVTLPEGRQIVHEAGPNGSSIFDYRVCPREFWTEVVEALGLPGDRTMVSVCMKEGGLRTEFGPRPETFVARGQVGLSCAEMITPTHADYTKHPQVFVQIETFTDYAPKG